MKRLSATVYDILGVFL